MEINECAPPISIQSKDINNTQKYTHFDIFLSPNNKTNNNKINNDHFDKYKTTMRFSYTKLKLLKKEYLLELIRFINDSCYLSLKDEKFINSTSSIFKIIKSLFSSGYDIIIDSNINNNVFEDNALYN